MKIGDRVKVMMCNIKWFMDREGEIIALDPKNVTFGITVRLDDFPTERLDFHESELKRIG